MYNIPATPIGVKRVVGLKTMSTLTIYTNQPNSELPNTVHGILASHVQKSLDETRQGVFVRLCTGENMTLGGNHNPCVYATLESSLPLEEGRHHSVVTTLQHILSEKLHVAKERTVVRYISVAPTCSSFNRSIPQPGTTISWT